MVTTSSEKPSSFLQAVGLSRVFYQQGRAIPAVQEASLNIARGEFICLMGPSGSGKTTLFNLLGGMDKPDAGRITFQGAPLEGASPAERARFRRDQIGTIFQSFNLCENMTARENVMLPLLLSRFSPRQAREKADCWLEAVGLSDRVDHHPYELSGGQQQRVALARALAPDPTLILADEPTGNLDERAGEEVVEMLVRFCRERKAAVLVATHDARFSSVADRHWFLEKGVLLEKEKPQYASLFEE